MQDNTSIIDDMFGIKSISGIAKLKKFNFISFLNSTVVIENDGSFLESYIRDSFLYDNMIKFDNSFVCVFPLNDYKDLLISLKLKVLKCKLAGMEFTGDISLFGEDFVIDNVKSGCSCSEFIFSDETFLRYTGDYRLVYFKMYEMNNNFYLVVFSGVRTTFGKVTKDCVTFAFGDKILYDITSNGVIKKLVPTRHSLVNKKLYNENF